MLSNVKDVLKEPDDQTVGVIILFCQALGLFPAIQWRRLQKTENTK